MADFEPAVEIVLKDEGGFVNNPADPGGATNFGISRRFLSQNYMPDGSNDIEHMTRDFAKDCYRKFFWDPGQYAQFESQDVANKVFNADVNMIKHQAARLLQLALGSLGYENLVPDGFVGSQTLALTNKASPDRLCSAFAAACRAHYKWLAQKRPDLAKFLPGWLKRHCCA